MAILVTGVAGFIGFHVMARLLERGDEVVGIDNLNRYYDVELKYARLAELGFERGQVESGRVVESKKHQKGKFLKCDIADAVSLAEVFSHFELESVVHLAAQAGVRYSLECPEDYIHSNIIGYFNLLECLRRYRVAHFVFASSSSVYGANESLPFSTQDKTDRPVSLYAATKKSDELMGYAYSHLFGIPMTGLRFFTVYGPWGRPDMALFIFTKAILEDKVIDVFNYGESLRDYTYIDDICDGIVRVLDVPPVAEAKQPPFAVYNIGNHQPVKLLDFITALEEKLHKVAKKNLLPMPTCDVPATFADIDDFVQRFQYHPATRVRDGIGKFVDWYLSYYTGEESLGRS